MPILYTVAERAQQAQGAQVQLSDGTLVFVTKVGAGTAMHVYYQQDRTHAPVLAATIAPTGLTQVTALQVTRDASDNVYVVSNATVSGTAGVYLFAGLTKTAPLTWTVATKTYNPADGAGADVAGDLEWLNTGGGTGSKGHLIFGRTTSTNLNMFTADAGAILAGTIAAFTSNTINFSTAGGSVLSVVPDGFGAVTGLLLYKESTGNTNAARYFSVSSTAAVTTSSALTVSAAAPGIAGGDTRARLVRLAAGKYAAVGRTTTTSAGLLTVQGITLANPPTLFGSATPIASMTGINLSNGQHQLDKDLLVANRWRVVYFDATTTTQVRYTVLTWDGATSWTWAGGSTLIDTMGGAVTALSTLSATGTTSPSYSDILTVQGTTQVQGSANVYEQPPNAPTLLAPVGNPTIDRNVTQRLSWAFSDPNVGDSQSKFDLQYRKGTGSWTTVSATTPNQFYDLPASTLTSDGSYEWQVRTYDQSSQVGPWSSSGFFTAATTPSVPTITAPANNSTVSLVTWTLSWSQPAQDAYEVRKVADLAGAPDATTIYYDSGTVTDTVTRSVVLSFPTNSRTEHLQVRVLKSGLWSAWADVTVIVNWGPPAVANIAVAPDTATPSIIVTYSQPTPGSGQPGVASVDIYRNDGSGSVRVAANLPATGVWTDYTPASGVAYTYRVVATATTGTTSTTAETS